MLFTNKTEYGLVLWVEDYVAESDYEVMNQNALQSWLDVRLTEEDMKWNLRSVSALAQMHDQTGSMLLYLPKDEDVDTSNDWVAKMMRELNEENVRNNDIRMLMVNSTVDAVTDYCEKKKYNHLLPWKLFPSMNIETSRSNIYLLSWYHK